MIRPLEQIHAFLDQAKCGDKLQVFSTDVNPGSVRTTIAKWKNLNQSDDRNFRTETLRLKARKAQIIYCKEKLT